MTCGSKQDSRRINARPAVCTAWTVLIVLAGLSGCVRDEAGRYYADKTYPPTPFDQVKVFYRAPDRPYEVIADYQAKGRGATERFMTQKAAEIGADAVIISKMTQEADAGREAELDAQIAATAIKFIDKP